MFYKELIDWKATICSNLTIQILEHSKLTKKTPEQHHWHSIVSTVNFEQVNAGWPLKGNGLII